MKPVRVLIVDDSATMRALLSASLQRDPEIEVVGSVAGAYEAREAIKVLNPDVITLDVEMPDMSGLDFLERLMRLRPTPVIMVSGQTQAGTDATIRALEMGAVDCIAKPSAGKTFPFARLRELIKDAARTDVSSHHKTAPSRAPRATTENYLAGDHVVAIGSSTGGVEALIAVLGNVPPVCPPIMIVQHMSAAFIPRFAVRLDRVCAPKVVEAEEGMPIEPGHIYLAPGGESHLELAGKRQPRCRLVPMDPVNGHRPSVDVLFHSVAKNIGPRAVGVLLTGMGRDGAEGLLAMRSAGASTIGQDQETSVVYGMPKAAWEIGAVEKQLPLGDICTELLSATSLKSGRKDQSNAIHQAP